MFAILLGLNTAECSRSFDGCLNSVSRCLAFVTSPSTASSQRVFLMRTLGKELNSSFSIFIFSSNSICSSCTLLSLASDVSKAASLSFLAVLPVTSLWTHFLMDALGVGNTCSAGGGGGPGVDHLCSEGGGVADCACGRVGSAADHLCDGGGGGVEYACFRGGSDVEPPCGGGGSGVEYACGRRGSDVEPPCGGGGAEDSSGSCAYSSGGSVLEHLRDGGGGGGIGAFRRYGAEVAWACGRSCRGADRLYVRGGGEVDWAYREGGGGVGSPIAEGLFSGNIGSRVSSEASSFSVKLMDNKK